MCKKLFSSICVCLVLGVVSGVAFGYAGQDDYFIPIGQPTIDGVISAGEWDSTDWIQMDAEYSPPPPYDLSDASFAALWSPSTNLIYVAVTGTDTDPCSPWKDDVWSFTVKTAEISKGDLTGDGYVGLDDVAVMADGWLTDQPRADIAPIIGDGSVSIADGDGIVNTADFALLSKNWLGESLLLSSSVLDLCSRRLMQTALAQDSDEYPGETDSAYTSWAIYTYPAKVEGWKLGFFPGCLWYMYELTNDMNFLMQAMMWNMPLEWHKNNTVFGDHGFVLLDSFGHWYRLTGETAYRDIVLQGAQSLASRYSPIVGCVRSWSWGDWESPTKFTVVVDTMMNLRILFWAARNGGGSDLYDKAVSHVYKTIENHVRSDGSTYHVVVYNPSTGNVSYKTTLQGYSTESCWSRGQAWALHGMTVAYRETDDPNILDAAKKIADYFVDNLPTDYVPYTDFKAPSATSKDSSAAAIAASGLLELCTLVADPNYQEKYYTAAKNILTSLCTRYPDGGYLAEDSDGNFLSPSILMRGCNRYGWNECGTIYGDYFFVMALMRYYDMTEF